MKKLSFVFAMFFLLIILSGAAFSEVDTAYDKGLRYFNSGKYEAAVWHFKKYVKTKPRASAYYFIGYALYELGKHDEAITYFDAAYLIDPEFSPLPPGKRPVEEVQPEPAPLPDIAPQEPSAGMGEIAFIEEPLEVKLKKTTAPLPQEAAVKEMKPGAPKAPAVVSAVQQVELSLQKKALMKGSIEQPLVFLSEKNMPRVSSGLLAAFGILNFLVVIAFYVYFCLCLFLIARKLGVPAAWTAWIPLVQIWTIVASAGKAWWWILLLIIPLVNAIVAIYLWMCISENLGKEKLLGLLMILPVVNFVFLGVLAFSGRAEQEPAPVAV